MALKVLPSVRPGLSVTEGLAVDRAMFPKGAGTLDRRRSSVRVGSPHL